MLSTPKDIIEFYREAYAKKGPTPQGMRWAGNDTHWYRLVRLRWLIGALDVPISRVLDVGCGIGMLYKLWEMRFHGGVYHGVEVVPEYFLEAEKLTATDPDAIISHEDFLNWWSVDPFSVTVAVGTFAWQPKENVDAIIQRMWALTMPGGVMAFTYIPDGPLSHFDVKMLGKTLPQVEEQLSYTGYSKQMGECMVVFKKKSRDQGWSYPYKHEEEIADEVLRGEHREEAYGEDEALGEHLGG